MSNENLAGAVEQLRRVAVALGYQRVWPDPRHADLWLMERPGKQQGLIEVDSMDAAIERLARGISP